jgi:outer membrane protein assembly factor BamB
MGLINGVVYVTNAGTQNGAPGGAVVMFDTNGNPLGHFMTPNASSPFGVLEHQGAILVSSANANDDIHRYSYTGTSLGTFHNTTSLNFAEQMAYAADGHVLVAGFSSNNVVKLDKDTGALISSFPASGARGVFQLENGNILWTNASGAHVYNPGTNSSTLVYSGGGRYLHLMSLPGDIEGDANGDGCVNDDDLLIVLFSFGETGPGLQGDLNRDGIVDDQDALLVLFNFGAGCQE